MRWRESRRPAGMPATCPLGSCCTALPYRPPAGTCWFVPAASAAWRRRGSCAHAAMGKSSRCAAESPRSPAAAPSLRPDLACAAHDILVAGQLLDTHRAAGVEAIGGDADLRSHAELAAIGELRRSVVEHDGAVHPLQEALCRRRVLRDD